MREAKRRAPKDTGKLAQSISMEMGKVGKDIVVRVGTNNEYAIFVHQGTADNGQGYIYPKNAKVLRWPIINNSGQGRRRYKAGATAKYAYAKRVRGVKARPFLRDALDAVIQ
jgi:HK97 gp10 family phage protein